MGNNSNFEEQCVQLAHEEWIGWLELSFRFNPFVGVANKFLWKISQRSHLVKLKKGQQVTLPHGGYIYEGLVIFIFIKIRSKDSLIKIDPQMKLDTFSRSTTLFYPIPLKSQLRRIVLFYSMRQRY